MNCTKNIRIFLTLSILTATSFLFAQTSKGWELLAENKRDEAEQVFEKSIKSNPNDADALLAMAYCKWIRAQFGESFKYVDAYYKIAPANKNAVLYALWTTDFCGLYRGNLDKTQLQFLNAIAEDKKGDGTLRACANYSLGNYNITKNKISEGLKYHNKIGAIRQWQIAGEFDNVSGSGFDKEYEPISKPEKGAIFLNKEGAKVGWVTVKNMRVDGYLDYDFLSSNQSNSIFYAQTFVNSPIEQDVLLCTGVSGSVKIWLNDALLGGVSEERNTDFDVYNFPIHLNKGYNRILTQVGGSELNSLNILVRITDYNYNIINDLTASDTYQSYTKAGVYTKKMLPLAAEKTIEMELQKNPKSLLHHFLMSDMYAHNGKYKECIVVLKKALEFAPKNTTLHQLLMSYESRLKNSEEASKEQNYILENDPDNFFSLQEKFGEEVKKEDYDAAEKIVEKMQSISGKESENIFPYQVAVLALKQKNAEVAKAVNRFYELFPNSLSAVKIKVSLEQELKNTKNVQNIWEKYYKENVSEEAMVSLYKIYTQTDNNEKGIKLYLDRIEKLPYAIGYYKKLAGIYYDTRNYEKSMAMLNNILEAMPYSGTTHSDIALVNEAMNKNDEAKAALKQAVYYSPTNYDIRKKLRKMENKKDIYTYFIQPDAYALAKKSPAASTYPDENSVILLNEIQKIVYPEGGSEERNIILIKIFNSAGVERWKEYSIGYNGYSQRLLVEKAEIIKANGTKIKADENNDNYVFSGLEAGDCIYLNFRIENYGKGKLANHFWETFYLGYDMPCQKSKYSLLVPSDKKFDFKVINGDTKPTITNADEFKLYTWERINPKAIVDEKLAPTMTDILEILHISSIPDWKFVADWYSDLSSIKAKSEPEVVAATQEALKGKEKETSLNKAKAIYEYIEKNIVYSSVSFRQSAHVPQRASKTLNAKLGDCKDVSTLFVAMAKEAGLKANLVLVDTHNNGEKDIILPSIAFNHCIAKLDDNGKEYYLELTWKNLSFGSSSFGIRDALYLDIPTDSKLVTNKVSMLKKLDVKFKPNVRLRDTDIKVEGNNITVLRKTKKTGYYAASHKDDYKNITKEEQEKSVLESISSSYKGQAKLLSLNFKNLDNLEDTLFYESKFNINNNITAVGNLKILSLNWTDALESVDFLAEDTRKYDLELNRTSISDLDREVIRLSLPTGKTFSELPASKKISFEDYIDYSIDYQVKGNTLVATRLYQLKKGVIPAVKYPQFKAFFNQILEEDAKQIGFK